MKTHIELLQEAHKKWVDHNFPDQEPYEPLLGIVEEVGELCHAQLKGEQRIRESAAEVNEDAKSDALGDILIYMLSYCNASGISLSQCVYDAWAEVRKRDWIRYPKDGVTS